jgi:hypothetical protein
MSNITERNLKDLGPAKTKVGAEIGAKLHGAIALELWRWTFFFFFKGPASWISQKMFCHHC